MKCFYIVLFLISQSFIVAMSGEELNKPRRSLRSAIVKQWCKLTHSVVECQQLLTTRDQEGFQDAQVIMRYDLEDVGKKRINAWRLDSDTILLVWMRMKDGSQVLLASAYSKGDWDKQKKCFQKEQNSLSSQVKESRAFLLYADDDRGSYSADTSSTCQFYEQALGMSVTSRMYRMISGSEYRDKNHLQITLDREGVRWKSAIDGFYAEHQL